MKKINLLIIGFVVVSVLGLLFLKRNFDDDSNLIGVYINDEYSSKIPLKDSGYYVDKIECDNGSSGEWDYTSWGLLTTNMNKKSKCNVYFKEDTITNSIKDELDTTGRCPSVNSDGSVNTEGVESENSLLCMAIDAYGTSYYFRGNVSNNYVYFAGLYWRIIRINGDGSIRLIYDGTTVHENGDASDDRIIGYSAFNEEYDDNTYVGYMYGIKGSSIYTETHANINDSTIKKYLDFWYENNIKDTSNEQYVVDNVFCNDRSLAKSDEGGGVGNNWTRYRWFEWRTIATSLICPQKNDAFTVNDAVRGNTALKYPISIISNDENELAGGFSDSVNENYYLFTGTMFWVLSADNFGQNIARNRDVRENGMGNNFDVSYNRHGVKPVINLKQGSLKSGDGTINNPYRID